jgi:MFS family permease
MITYMDRVVMSNAAPAIQKEFGFSIVTMGWILGSYRWTYAAFQIPVAWFGDRYGPRRVLTVIVLCWSVLTSATTLAWSAASMIAIRFLFGAGEAGAFRAGCCRLNAASRRELRTRGRGWVLR